MSQASVAEDLGYTGRYVRDVEKGLFAIGEAQEAERPLRELLIRAADFFESLPRPSGREIQPADLPFTTFLAGVEGRRRAAAAQDTATDEPSVRERSLR